MDRQTRTLVVVGLAVLLAGAASYGVYLAIQSRPVVEVAIAERYAVVATQTVPVGVLLTPEMLRVVAWPADAPVAGGFEKVEDAVGRGVTVGMVVNEPVTESKLAPRESGGGLPPTITPGMRAISVKVNDVISVAGFTAPGHHVDVIVTIRTSQDTITRTVLSNVQVLAAGADIDVDKARTGERVPATVVTLLLTPPDAEKLTLAAGQGQIMLALRNPLDTDKTETSGVRVGTLLAGLGPEPTTVRRGGQTRVVTPPPPPPPPQKTVTNIRGTTQTQQIIKKDQESIQK